MVERAQSYPGSVEAVARAIAQNGFGRPWDDFLPVNAHDTDQSDLIEYAQAALDAGSGDGCFDMLWAWFTERRGADDMRANAADGGLSADDFKLMLDDHERNIMAPQPTIVAEETPTKEDFAKWSRVWHDTCETMVTLLGLPGSGSPQELLAQVQAYVGTRPPAQGKMQHGCPYIEGDECLLEKHSFGPCLCANPVAQQPIMSPAGKLELAKLIDAEAWLAIQDGRNTILGSLWAHRRDWARRKADTIISALPDLYSLSSTVCPCAKCGCETGGEIAFVSGEIWCHPCADGVALSSTVSNTPEGK